MGFESCHPAVNFLFFAAAIYGSVAFQHQMCIRDRLCGESPLEGSIPFDVGRYREQLGEIDV